MTRCISNNFRTKGKTGNKRSSEGEERQVSVPQSSQDPNRFPQTQEPDRAHEQGALRLRTVYTGLQTTKFHRQMMGRQTDRQPQRWLLSSVPVLEGPRPACLCPSSGWVVCPASSSHHPRIDRGKLSVVFKESHKILVFMKFFFKMSHAPRDMWSKQWQSCVTVWYCALTFFFGQVPGHPNVSSGATVQQEG